MFFILWLNKVYSFCSSQEQPSTASATTVNPDWSGFQVLLMKTFLLVTFSKFWFHIVSGLLYILVVFSTGIFSYTSTRVLGIKSPSSSIYVGGSGTNYFVLTFSKQYALVAIKTYGLFGSMVGPHFSQTLIFLKLQNNIFLVFSNLFDVRMSKIKMKKTLY